MKPIGSSSVGAVLGLSPYATAADVQARLLGAPGHAAGWAAELGNLLEPALRAEYERRIDRPVHAGPPYGTPPWPVAEHQISHPDAWYEAADGARLVEIKTSSSWDGWDEEGLRALPRPDYAVQGIHQLEARHPAGLELVGVDVYALCVETGERRVYQIKRDGRGARLVARVGAWYDRHVVQAEPCPPAAPAVYLPAAQAPRRYVEATEADRELVAGLREARRVLRAAEAAEQAAREALLARIGDADGLGERGALATHHAQSARRIVPERVRELADARPDLAPLLDRCWSNATSRVLRLPKE